ncbi:hypothetical protein GQ54DRAFT_160845 [Martensiomyces pterosporus]|nr:hypothetical protein GQ54DRAFT_160845 [Martensiomyces pterosporus]
MMEATAPSGEPPVIGRPASMGTRNHRQRPAEHAIASIPFSAQRPRSFPRSLQLHSLFGIHAFNSQQQTMSFEYLGPTRYDSSDSEDEALSEPTVLSPPAPRFVVRIKPSFLPAVQAAETLAIRLLPTPATEGGLEDSQYEQIGLIYSPAVSRKQQFPIGATLQTSNALARILKAPSDGAVIHVLANTELPSHLQHGWVRALMENLKPKRIVLLDTLDADLRSAGAASTNAYHTPAVLASVLILGLSAAVLNYAETYKVPCRHLRVSGGQLAGRLISAKDAEALFDGTARSGRQQSTAADSDMIRHDVSTSLYV